MLCNETGYFGGNVIRIGEPKVCRFCGETDTTLFKKKAHTFPESIGNKWVFSLDECDRCNLLFGDYEDALATCVRPFLTLGGVRGKKGVPQLGRSKGQSSIKHIFEQGKRGLSLAAQVEDLDSVFRPGRSAGVIEADFIVPPARFRPRLAYKALVKMGIALLPREELGNYSKLRTWLQTKNDEVDFPSLDVLMSFVSVGNSPDMVSGTLLRRLDPIDVVPHILFFLTAGSVCFQIDLLADELDSHIPHVDPCHVKIRWTSVLLGESDDPPIKLRYSDPTCLDWSAADLADPPVEKLKFEFNVATTHAQWTPIMRES